jgi:hypothetical protein
MHWLLLPVLAQALSGTVADRTEVRTRGDGSGQYVDLQNTPRLELKVNAQRAQWSLVYSPTIAQLDVTRATTWTMQIQSASLFGNMQLSRRANADFGTYGMWGHQSFRALSVAPVDSTGTTGPATAPGGGAPGQPTTAPSGGPLAAQTATSIQAINYALLISTIGLGYRFAPRWSGRLQGTYDIGGGLDRSSKLVVPRSRQIEGAASLTHIVTHKDQLVLKFEGLQATTQSVSTQVSGTRSSIDATIFDGTLDWLRRFTNNVSGDLDLGVAYAEIDSDGSGKSAKLLPVGGLQLQASELIDGWRCSASVLETYSPFIDRITGTVTERSMTTLSVQSTKSAVTLRTSLYAIGTGTRIGAVSLLSAYGAEESILYRLSRHWNIETGARQALQSYQSATQQPLVWAVYLAVVGTTGETRL